MGHQGLELACPVPSTVVTQGLPAVVGLLNTRALLSLPVSLAPVCLSLPPLLFWPLLGLCALFTSCFLLCPSPSSSLLPFVLPPPQLPAPPLTSSPSCLPLSTEKQCQCGFSRGCRATGLQAAEDPAVPDRAPR